MHRAPGPYIQVRPPLRPQAFQHFNISLKNGISLGENRYSTVDAFFTQQMQGGIRRVVWLILKVPRLSPNKNSIWEGKTHPNKNTNSHFFKHIITPKP